MPGSGLAAAIRAGWQRAIADLPDGATIVDLGCGNGNLLIQLQQSLAQQGRAARCVGFDVADIQISGDAPSVVLHGRTAMEKLPLRDATADLVISQFAIEYSDWPVSAAEALRVLRPGGRLRFLVHTQSSAIVRRAAAQRDGLNQIVAAGVPVLLRAAMDALMAATKTASARDFGPARAATLALVAQLDELDRRDWPENAKNLIGDVLARFRATPKMLATMPHDEAAAQAQLLCTRLDAQIARFDDLARAALDTDDLARMQHCLTTAQATLVACDRLTVPAADGAMVEAGAWVSGHRAGG